MQRVICVAGIAGLFIFAGCALPPAQSPTSTPVHATTTETNDPASDTKLIVTPELGLNGRVVRANLSLRFVVLNFPVGQMPLADQRMNVYRRGLKVGEVKVNAQPLEDNVTADIIIGEAGMGDIVRDR